MQPSVFADGCFLMKNNVLILFVLVSRLLVGQSMTFSPENLVPNPSFEDTVTCPTYIGQLYNAEHWYSPTSNTPDYFNACFDDWVNAPPDVPVNAFGIQDAHFGNGYAGFGGYYTPNNREYVAVQLIDTLQAGKKYCFEFFVSLCDSCPSAVNSIGIYFSQTNDTMFVGPHFSYLPYQPIWELDTIASDTDMWMPVRGNFVAVGGEKYLIIGIFKPDSLLTIDTIYGGGMYAAAYYYIDDVSVWKCDTAPVTYSEFTLFPNPSNGQFNISGNFPAGSELIVYNMLGQVWCNPIALPEGNNNVPMWLDLAQGVYFYRIRAHGETLNEDRIIISK